jgi:hypothetical protein
MKRYIAIVLMIVAASLVHSWAHACPDGGSAPCRPGDHFSFDPGPGPSFNVLPVPELNPDVGATAILALVVSLIVIRGRRK